MYGLITIVLNVKDQLNYVNDEKEFERIVSNSDNATTESKSVYETIKEINSDYRAWVNIEDTKINYPVLQTTDNNYYLSHRYNKERHPYGSIFLDYRNTSIETSKHLAIYGHSVNEKAMFGYLTEYIDQDYANNHGSLTLESENEVRTYQLFSVRIVDADVETLKINGIDNHLSQYIDELIDESIIDADNDFARNQILTLVTCDNNYQNGRILVHFYLKSVENIN